MTRAAAISKARERCLQPSAGWHGAHHQPVCGRAGRYLGVWFIQQNTTFATSRAGSEARYLHEWACSLKGKHLDGIEASAGSIPPRSTTASFGAVLHGHG